ncbi:MAG: 5'-nucleotidase C-terminal domain-containing protein [Desulforhopalus sp.]
MRAHVLRFLTLTACFVLTPFFTVQAKEYKLTILHTNDHHGHFQKFHPYPLKDIGGLAAQSTLVDAVRSEVKIAGGNVLLLSAGDVNTGVPESDILDAEPDFTLMNVIGYDAMALGNHEFDNSQAVLLGQKALADFPFLAANVVKKNSGELLVAPYIIKNIDGLKVAVLGLTTEDVPKLVLPDNVEGLEFQDVIATAKKYIPELKKQADLIIALTHIGLHGSDIGGTGDIELAEAVPDIDVIVGGHTHTNLEQPVVRGDTLIVQADAYSEKVGRLNLIVDSDNDRVSSYSYELIPVIGDKTVRPQDKKHDQHLGPGFAEDKEILETMTKYLDGAEELLHKPVGTALVELVGGKSVSRSHETNLGNLITDGMRAKTGADIALQNGGGIRAGIAPGTITYRDVLSAQPFANTLTEISMTGAQIMEVLNAAAAKIGSGGFLHVSGLQVTYNSAAGRAEKVVVGEGPIAMEKTYKVVTNNFLAAGGDGYDMLKNLPKYDTGYVDAETTMLYIRNLGRVAPAVEGRITIVP